MAKDCVFVCGVGGSTEMDVILFFGGGGNEFGMSICLGGFVSCLCFVDKFCTVFTRDGGGLSKIFLVSDSEGRGGRIGFGNSISGDVRR